MLEARGLFVNLGATPILRGVDLTLRPGTVTGVLSLEKIETRVLLSVLSGQEQPGSGTVTAQGAVQLVPGTSRLFGNLTILDNLMVGLDSPGSPRVSPGRTIRRIRPLLDEFGLERSLETKVGKLTIPEQQVVSAALFLIQEAPVLLVRDVYGNLTLDQYRLLVAKTRDLAASGRTIGVVPDHAAQLFDLCDEVVLVRNGRSILSAPVSDLDVEEVRNVLNNTEYLILQTLENKFHQFQSTISEPEILFERSLKVLANFCALPQGFVLSAGPGGSTVLTSGRAWKGPLPGPTVAAGLHRGALALARDQGSLQLDGRPFTWTALQPGDPAGAVLFLAGGEREFPYSETLDLFRRSVALLADRVRQEAAARERELQTIRLGKEMDIARNIQSSILPRKSTLEGYTIATHMETATEVGGDSYDLLPTSLGNFISVGDVSGHGLPSGIMALIEMAALHGVIQTHLELQAPPVPSTIYDLVNRVLCEINRDRIGSDKFMTKVLLVENGGRFHHAGTHEIGLLYSRKDGRITELSQMVDNTGFLGLSEYVDSRLSLGEFTMDEGDFLLLYTDGLIEAKNASGEQYGIERVKASLLKDASRPPETLLADLRGDLLAFAEAGDRQKHGGRLADDLTLMLIRRDRAPGPVDTRAEAAAH